MPVGFASSARFVEHESGPHHPERGDRIRAVYAALEDAGLLASVNPFPDFRQYVDTQPRSATPLTDVAFGPVDEEALLTVHPRTYVERIKHVCAIGGGVLDSGDTAVGPSSHEIARLAVGAVLGCCDAVLRGSVRRAFAAVRPPGHHAEPDRPMGFCLYANVALAARYVQRAYGVERVAIVDFDVHHGNGTQAVFDADPSVFFCSLHQHPRTCYPGTGYEWEIGVGAGRGTTLNLPFDPGSDDDDYQRVIDTRVVPALDAFRPQVLFISAGFDAHTDDPLADMNLSDEAYERMTRALCQVADVHCNGRVISTLEGGYNLAALGRSVVRHVRGLGG